MNAPDTDSSSAILFSEETPKPESVPKILFVDDEASVLSAIKRFCRAKPWQAFYVQSGEEGLKLLKQECISVVVSDMRMPGMNGYEFLREVRKIIPTASRILLTGYSDLDSLSKTINEAGLHSYIPKPWDDSLIENVIVGAFRYQDDLIEKQRLEKLTKDQKNKLGKLALTLDRQVKEKTIEIEQAMTLLQRSHVSLQNNFYDTLASLTRIIEWKEGRDEGHSQFVAKYAQILAEKAGLMPKQIENVRIASLLHRIGMVALPHEMRDKSFFSLTEDEREVYQKYPVWGQMVLTSAPGLDEIAEIIRHVHENVNGHGFPDQLIDKKIPIESKIIGLVCDFYDVFNGHAERNISGLKDAINYLTEWAGKKYDLTLTNLFLPITQTMMQAEPSVFSICAEDVHEDLVLAKDVILDNGIMLLGRGTYLCEKSIEKIRRYEKNLNVKIDLIVSKPNADVGG